ncbi:MAG: TIGR04013 family B12-binding domain/radical SAM domain-containing protein [bacterium]
MKVERPLLIMRRTRENRYTLPTLLGGLEEKGWTRKISITTTESLKDLKEKIQPRITLIGYSFMTPWLIRVKEEIEDLRKTFQDEIIIIAGGPHPTADPQGTLKLGFDFVFLGEAEETWPEFVEKFFAGRLPAEKIISPRNKKGCVPSFPPFFSEDNFFAPLEITRGCPYGCTFCQTPRIFGNYPRHRNLDNLTQQLQKAAAFGYQRCSFISPNALAYGAKDDIQPNLSALRELFTACQEAGYTKINFGSFPSEVRPDWVSKEVLELIKKFCHNRTIVLGGQSGSNALLQKLHRGHTAESALEAVKLIYQAGFLPHVDFIFGFPEESSSDRLLSLNLATRMIEEYGAKIHAHSFLPLPGTPLFYKEPSLIDEQTKNTLIAWEKKKKLDGWWKEQEVLAWEIIKWRDQRLICVS